MLAEARSATSVGEMRRVAVARDGAGILQIAAQLRMMNRREASSRGEMWIIEILLGTPNW